MGLSYINKVWIKEKLCTNGIGHMGSAFSKGDLCVQKDADVTPVVSGAVPATEM